MACQACREVPVEFNYRWKNANIILIGCYEHVVEITKVLNMIQEQQAKESRQVAIMDDFLFNKRLS